MIVDEPQGYMYYGSLVAAPYAGRVFESIFDYKNIAPTELPAVEYALMPNVIGMAADEAAAALEKIGLHVELVGESGSVVAQTPVPNTRVAVNDSVLIRTQ